MESEEEMMAVSWGCVGRAGELGSRVVVAVAACGAARRPPARRRAVAKSNLCAATPRKRPNQYLTRPKVESMLL